MRFNGIALAAVLATIVSAWPANARAGQTAAAFVRKAGNYQVELRVPADGLYADDETDVEMRVTDQSQDDPVQGAPPIIHAKVVAKVTMPAMASMPPQAPKTHSEGVAGDYGVVMYFPHGGAYLLQMTITPPGAPPFNVSYKLDVQDAAPPGTRPHKPAPFTLEVRTAHPPRAGVPTDLILTIRDRSTGKPVQNFDIEHEKKIHAVIVSRSLSFFAHEHPTQNADGSFALRFTFPVGGEYRVFTDVAPAGFGSIVLMQPLEVNNGDHDLPLDPPVNKPGEVDGVDVRFGADAAKLVERRTLPLTFRLVSTVGGTPITDLQPYLGAMGHLILIHSDSATFVHCHPDETDPANGHNGSITFLARFPKPGEYHGWLQFQRNGTVETSKFILNVPEKRPQ